MTKKHLIQFGIIILIFSACTPSSQNCPEDPPLAPQFLSQIYLKGEAALAGSGDNDGAGELIEIIGLVIDQAFSGSLMTYDATLDGYKDLVALTPDEFEEKLIRIDTSYMENPKPPYKLEIVTVTDTFKGRNLSALRVFESWKLSESFKLEKTVSHYMPVRENIDPLTGKLRGWNPLFIATSNEPSGEPIKVAQIQYTQPVVKKDGDYKYQWYRENLETSVREKFFEGLLTSLKSGDLTCYASANESDLLDKEAIEAALFMADTMYIENPDPPHDLQMAILEMNLDWYNVNAIEFVQNVSYYANGSIEIDVKWYRPIMGIPDPVTGDLIGSKRLCWIKNG